MIQIPKFTKLDGNSLLFNGGSSYSHITYYIPEFYFERGLAESEGEYIKLFGLFNYSLYDRDKKPVKLVPFNFPSTFYCKPSSIEVNKNIKLSKYTKEDNYKTLLFYNNDMLMVNIYPPKDATGNTEKFINLFNSGKIPNTIPYNKLHEIYLDNIELNGASYPINNQLIGIIISELATKFDDNSIPYTDTDMTEGYSMISIKDKPKLVSPFTSIMSENFDESVRNAIVNQPSAESPLERLLTR